MPCITAIRSDRNEIYFSAFAICLPRKDFREVRWSTKTCRTVLKGYEVAFPPDGQNVNVVDARTLLQNCFQPRGNVCAPVRLIAVSSNISESYMLNGCSWCESTIIQSSACSPSPKFCMQPKSVFRVLPHSSRPCRNLLAPRSPASTAGIQI